jgi:hypothetical protein
LDDDEVENTSSYIVTERKDKRTPSSVGVLKSNAKDRRSIDTSLPQEKTKDKDDFDWDNKDNVELAALLESAEVELS